MTQKGLFDAEPGYIDLNNGIPEGYTIINLNDMKDDQEFQGKPLMSKPYTFDFEDRFTSEITEKNACKLALIDDTVEKAVLININLKQEGDIQKNIFKGSVLFDLIASIHEIDTPGCMEGFNVFKNLNLKKVREIINKWSNITIIAHTITGDYQYNTVKVTSID